MTGKHLLLALSLSLLIPSAAWPQVTVEHVRPFNDSLLADSRDSVQQNLPALRQYAGQLEAVFAHIKSQRERVPPDLLEAFDAEMVAAEDSLMAFRVGLRMLDSGQADRVGVSAFLSPYYMVTNLRIAALRWAGLLLAGRQDPVLERFLRAELSTGAPHVAGYVPDPDGMIDSTLASAVSMTCTVRDDQVKQLRALWLQRELRNNPPR